MLYLLPAIVFPVLSNSFFFPLEIETTTKWGEIWAVNLTFARHLTDCVLSVRHGEPLTVSVKEVTASPFPFLSLWLDRLCFECQTWGTGHNLCERGDCVLSVRNSESVTASVKEVIVFWVLDMGNWSQPLWKRWLCFECQTWGTSHNLCERGDGFTLPLPVPVTLYNVHGEGFLTVPGTTLVLKPTVTRRLLYSGPAETVQIIFNNFKGHFNGRDQSCRACMQTFHWDTNAPLWESSPAFSRRSAILTVHSKDLDREHLWLA